MILIIKTKKDKTVDRNSNTLISSELVKLTIIYSKCTSHSLCCIISLNNTCILYHLLI